MDTLELFGYAASLLIGVSLGLIGSGGSILTVPILVYLFNVKPELATAYSLAIVGTTALAGSYQNIKEKLVHTKTTIVFAIPSMIGVYLAHNVLLPALPNHLFSIGDFQVSKDLAIMILFSVLMILSSVSMIKGKKDSGEEEKELHFNYPMIALEGIVVGGITGIVGAGGGFLVIPALVLFVGLPMKMAVGSSLLIIAAKSLFGFLGDIGNPEVDFAFLGLVTLLSIVGIFIGNYAKQFIAGSKLKPAFGYFVLIMGVYIIGKELL